MPRAAKEAKLVKPAESTLPHPALVGAEGVARSGGSPDGHARPPQLSAEQQLQLLDRLVQQNHVMNQIEDDSHLG